MRAGFGLYIKNQKRELPDFNVGNSRFYVPSAIRTRGLSLRSKALGTLLLVYRCLMKFLKSLDLRGFLAIVGT